MRGMWQWALVAAVLAVPTFGQDSVSNNPTPAIGVTSLPGDALDPWTTTYQCKAYVVDLVPFHASWGTYFKIAPLAKSSKTDSTHFTSLWSAQSISRLQARGVQYPVTQYALWESQPGFGVNATENDVPNNTAPSGLSNQFAAVFSEFATTDAAVDYNGVIGAVINYDPLVADRLYVKRVIAATNGLTNAANYAKFGVGAVDEQGNVLFRADAGLTAGFLTGNNVFHVNLLGRNCSAVNYINDNGMSDAASGHWVVAHDLTYTYNTPNIGPTAKFTKPYYIGTDSVKEYVYRPADLSVALARDLVHLGTATDHRGALAYMSKNVSCAAGAYGTAAMLGKSPSGPTDRICVWGLNADASVAGVLTPTLPGVQIADPTTGMLTYPVAAFDHYHSQTMFSGGNGAVAIGVDQAGRLLVAGVLYDLGWTPSPLYSNQFNDIVVGRVTCAPTPTTQWSLVAYSSNTNRDLLSGKPIYGADGTVQIGMQVCMDEVTGGTPNPNGPSMSAPMIDSVGNIWFISTVYLTAWKDGTPRQFPDYDTALIRAVYDPGTLGYKLEEVLETGDLFLGPNSGKNWRVNFMSIADSDSVDSGTAWSSNMAEKAYLGLDPRTNLPQRHPSAMGGLVLCATVIYDMDNDGKYNDPTSTNYDPTLASDEAYNVLLYIGAGCLAGDNNGDGAVNGQDIDGFVQALFDQSAWIADHPNLDLLCADDLNGDGAVNGQDIDGFVYLLFN